MADVKKINGYDINDDVSRTNVGCTEDTYNSNSTYKTNDIVIYEKAMYKCISAITTPEEWNSEHWQQICLRDLLVESRARVSATEPKDGLVWIKKGKNLFNYKDTNYYNAYINTGKQIWEAANENLGYKSCIVKVEPYTTYTISKTAGQTFRIATYTNYPTLNATYNDTQANHTGTHITFTTGANDNYIVILCFSTANNDIGTYLEMYATVMVEQGSTATTYEAYIEKEIYVKNENGVFERFYKEETLTNVNYTDYVNFGSNVEVISAYAYKTGNIVFINYDINATLSQGQTILGSVTSKVVTSCWGSGRAYDGKVVYPATLIAIPGGELRIMTTLAATKSAGQIILLVV